MELGYASVTSREDQNTPAGNLASGGAWSATLGAPGQTHPDLARSRRCATSGRDTLFGNVHPTNRDRA